MKDIIAQVNLSDLNNIFNKLDDKKNFFIFDEKIFDFYKDQLNLEKFSNIFKLKNPEQDKNLTKFTECLNHFIDREVRRDCQVWAFGGGAVCDFSGFVAASALRGINWNCIPTSLLAMVDASIGGKVGLNLPQGKNLVGAFHQPNAVYLCSSFLESLPADEFNSGLGEIIKYAFLSTEINRLVKKGAGVNELIFACVKYKKEIIEKDFKEEGDRKVLNFGHTLGHAFEKECSVPHGIAVILGIYHTLKTFHYDLLTELYSLMDILKLDRNILFTRPENLRNFWNLVYKDKKIIGDEVQFVQLRSLGYPIIKKIKISELESKIAFK